MDKNKKGPKEKNVDTYEYLDSQDYYTNQKVRAKTFVIIFMIGILVTIGVYLAFHLETIETTDGTSALQWRSLDKESPWQDRVVDWLLWGLVGTQLFLLREVGHYYPDISDNAKKEAFLPSFIEYTPWYWVNLIKGPIIALVIILFLNTAQLSLSSNGESAFNFNFQKLDHRVTLLFAFIFGYYSRVARHVLNGIVQNLFPSAWAETYETFQISPDEDEILPRETIVFKTEPLTEVVWAATLGEIDAAGKYTAPSDPGYSGQKAVITAVSTGKKSIAQSASVTIVPFGILGPREVVRGSKYAYKTSTGETEVIWSVSPSTGTDLNITTGEYTVPPKTEIAEEKIFVTAKRKKKVKAPDGTMVEIGNSIEVKLIET